MKNIKTVLAAILCAGCVIFTGCGDDANVSSDVKNVSTEQDALTEKDKEEQKDASKTNPSAGNVEENKDTEDDTLDGEEENSENSDEPKAFINGLTGIETTEELAGTRPVAIMINNLKQALPQQGITEADIIYEVPAEGGITRLLCLYTDYTKLPETGSVRSSRDYYIDLSDAHDAIYVHCGTSPQAKAVLDERDTDNMDGIYFDTPFYRNKTRQKNMGYEHSLMTTGELLAEGIRIKGYRTTSDAKQPLSFYPFDCLLESGLEANYAKLVFSPYQTVELEYDEESGLYLKKQYGKEHIDSNNNIQLSFQNAVVLFCNQGMIPGDDAGRIYVNFYGSGDGYFLSNGEYKKIKWYKESRTSSYTLYEEDGTTELLLNPGKSYIAIAPMSATFTVK